MKKLLQNIIKKQLFQYIAIIVLVGLNVYLLTYPSKILGIIIDLLYNIEKNKPLILNNIILLILASIGILLIRVIWKYLVGKCTRYFEKELKDKLFSQFLSVKLTSIQNIKNGELMSYFIKDVGEIRGFLYRLLSHGTRIVFVFIIATNTMKNVNLSLTIATLCPILITIYIVIILKKYVEKSYKKGQRYFTSLSEYVQESTDAIRTTKAYSGERNQLKKFIKKNAILKKGNIAIDVYSTLLSSSVSICFGFCYGITILYGSKLVLDKTISIGDFVAFNGYIDLFFTPIFWLPGIISKFKRAQISFHRLDKVFTLEKEILISENSKKTQKIHGDITIKNLSFNYPGNIDKVLENINITIKEGSTLGIIGTIGSGKTTLMNLLLKLYTVPEGKIFINNQDINSINLSLLRESICYITQDNFLFSTTIKDNIRLFREDFNDSEIKNSTEKAMLSDDLINMNNDIYTVIGEKGIDLSGGQKQRVVISRAFLRNSKFVIFDDTFSALDNKTEEKVLKNIKELVNGKTCIIISNRISDVKDSDHIIVLDSGKIIEEGTHNELLNNNGLYNKFYNQQSSNNQELLA
jgi:ATP-binding cassette subfamily B multidrug efflux pump